MKRFAAILLLCAMMLVSLSACAVKETVALTYGEKYQITNKKLDRYENLDWSSSDASIAEVQYGRISAVGAGTTLITAEADGKEVAEFTVKVSIVPITGIVLSAKATEVTEEENFKLEYTLFPEDASVRRGHGYCTGSDYHFDFNRGWRDRYLLCYRQAETRL